MMLPFEGGHVNVSPDDVAPAVLRPFRVRMHYHRGMAAKRAKKTSAARRAERPKHQASVGKEPHQTREERLELRAREFEERLKEPRRIAITRLKDTVTSAISEAGRAGLSKGLVDIETAVEKMCRIYAMEESARAVSSVVEAIYRHEDEARKAVAFADAHWEADEFVLMQPSPQDYARSLSIEVRPGLLCKKEIAQQLCNSKVKVNTRPVSAAITEALLAVALGNNKKAALAIRHLLSVLGLQVPSPEAFRQATKRARLAVSKKSTS